MNDLFSVPESLTDTPKDTTKHTHPPPWVTPTPPQAVEAFQDPDLPWEVTGEYLLTNPVTEIPFLVEGLVPRFGLVALAGSSDTGKSMLLRQLVISIVRRFPDFLGFRITARHHSAIYVSTEDGIEATSYLLNKQANGQAPEQLKGLRFFLDSEDLFERLDKSLAKNPADIVIVDCFSDAYGYDLKDSAKIRLWMNQLQKIADKRDCLVMFLHHASKRSENERPNKNNLLSGQAFEAKVRLVIELRLDLINPNIRHLCIVKGNYLPAKSKSESFVLTFDEESFLFENTGDRIPFDELRVDPKEDSRKDKFLQAEALQTAGKTLDEIAVKIGYSGKGAVSKLLKTGKEKGWK